MTGQLGFLGNGAEIIQLAAKTLTFRVRLACSRNPQNPSWEYRMGKWTTWGDQWLVPVSLLSRLPASQWANVFSSGSCKRSDDSKRGSVTVMMRPEEAPYNDCTGCCSTTNGSRDVAPPETTGCFYMCLSADKKQKNNRIGLAYTVDSSIYAKIGSKRCSIL